MRGMSSSFSAQRIAAHLGPAAAVPGTRCAARSGAGAAQGVAVEVVAETGSTNADLLARLTQLDGPLALVAERQTAGRGRAGRSWHSEPGAVLTFSLAWRFNRPLHGLIGLPLAVGVALAETLSALEVPVQLKWPNDVLKGGRKLGGILIEAAKVPVAADAAPQSWAVIGIGLNLKQPANVLAQIGQPVASLDLPHMDGNLLLGTIIADLSDALAQFDEAGLASFAERWNRWHAHAGKLVRIHEGERVLHEGRALRITGQGALMLETAQGTVSVMSGDVSLRAVENGEEGSHVVTG